MHKSKRIHSVQNKDEREENGPQKHDKKEFKVDSFETAPLYTMAQKNQEKREKRIKNKIGIDDTFTEIRIKKIIETGSILRLSRIKKVVKINNQESLSIQGKFSGKQEEKNKLKSEKKQ